MPRDEAGESELLVLAALAPGVRDDDFLRARTAALLREQCSPRHVPDRLVAVPAIPRNRAGKRLEVPAKRVLAGQAAVDACEVGSLEDPDAMFYLERERGAIIGRRDDSSA